MYKLYWILRHHISTFKRVLVKLVSVKESRSKAGVPSWWTFGADVKPKNSIVYTFHLPIQCASPRTFSLWSVEPAGSWRPARMVEWLRNRWTPVKMYELRGKQRIAKLEAELGGVSIFCFLTILICIDNWCGYTYIMWSFLLNGLLFCAASLVIQITVVERTPYPQPSLQHHSLGKNIPSGLNDFLSLIHNRIFNF